LRVSPENENPRRFIRHRIVTIAALHGRDFVFLGLPSENCLSVGHVSSLLVPYLCARVFRILLEALRQPNARES